MITFVYSSLWNFKSCFTCRKILRHGTFLLYFPFARKVFCVFLSPLKIHHLGRVLNLQPLGPVASTLTTTPPRKLLPNKSNPKNAWHQENVKTRSQKFTNSTRRLCQLLRMKCNDVSYSLGGCSIWRPCDFSSQNITLQCTHHHHQLEGLGTWKVLMRFNKMGGDFKNTFPYHFCLCNACYCHNGLRLS
jgi:hypothetical protein